MPKRRSIVEPNKKFKAFRIGPIIPTSFIGIWNDEIILGKKLINSAFRRVIAKKVEEIDEEIKTGGHRPSKKFKYKGE